MPEPLLATRVEFYEARRHFLDGGAVIVSEFGSELTWPVTPGTATHTKETTTWDELAATVAMWRNRYPNQRFYVIPQEKPTK